MIKVVDHHHKVLKYWAECRNSAVHAPRLLTLDHHTDTSKPFRKAIGKKIKSLGLEYSEAEFLKLQKDYFENLNYNNPDSVDYAVENLSHDEHVVTAIKSGIISSALVIAHNALNTDLETYKNHKIICSTVPEEINTKGIKKPIFNCVLESEFLKNSIDYFNSITDLAKEIRLLDGPYILDIDLDYFNTFDSIKPKEDSFFKQLAKNASLITIATEPEYVKICAAESGLTADYLLSEMNRILEDIWV